MYSIYFYLLYYIRSLSCWLYRCIAKTQTSSTETGLKSSEFSQFNYCHRCRGSNRQCQNLKKYYVGTVFVDDSLHSGRLTSQYECVNHTHRYSSHIHVCVKWRRLTVIVC